MEEVEHEGDPREPARLHALFASPGAPASRGTVLFLHGKGGCAAEWRPDAARALRLGWNALVADLRGHAPSGGRRVTYGALEEEDLVRLLDAARARWGVEAARVAVDACSMGSLVALRLAARVPAIAGLWLQSPFGGLRRMAGVYLARATGIPAALLALPARLAVGLVEKETGFDLAAIDPVATARRVTAPAVVVYGETDVLVPEGLAREVFDALSGPKDWWRVPRAGHCHHPDEPQALYARLYARRWTAFFRGAFATATSRALPGRRRRAKPERRPDRPGAPPPRARVRP